jgi:hypothetical protein
VFSQVASDVYHKFISIFSQLTQGKYWIFKVTIFTLFLAIFIATPRYIFPRESSAEMFESGVWHAVSYKANDLTMNLETNAPSPVGSGGKRVNYRLTVPIIARIFNLNPQGILVIQWIAGIFLFATVTQIVYKLLEDRISAFMSTITIGLMATGNQAFLETRARFDSISYFLISLAILSPSPVVIICSIFIAAWNDERALITSCLAFLFWLLQALKSEKSVFKALFSSQICAIFISWILYFAVRLWYSTKFNIGIQYDPGLGFQNFIKQSNAILMGAWVALEGAWVLVFAAIYILIRERKYVTSILYISGISIVILLGLFAVDISRSVAYVFPAIFVALLIIGSAASKQETRKVIFISMLLTFIFPAYCIGGVSTYWLSYPIFIELPLWLLERIFGIVLI